MTDDDKKFIGFRLAMHLEDSIKKAKRIDKDKTNRGLWGQIERLEFLTYTEFIPDAWIGDKPDYWKKYEK